MFYFALKIKRPEVAEQHVLSSLGKGAGPKTSAQWKSLCFVAGRLEPFTLENAVKRRLIATETSMTKIKLGDKVDP